MKILKVQECKEVVSRDYGLTATTSPSLLIQVRDPNDKDAWEQFTSIYTGIIRDYCIQRRLQPSDIDDIVQDVMASVFASIRKFEYDPSKGRFRAWLGTIAANKIKTFLSKQNRREADSNETLKSVKSAPLTQYIDPDVEWANIFSEKIYQVACSRIRSEFNEVAWECFQALWVRGESVSDIANTLGISINAAFINRYRVLKRLESEIKIISEDFLPSASFTD